MKSINMSANRSLYCFLSGILLCNAVLLSVQGDTGSETPVDATINAGGKTAPFIAFVLMCQTQTVDFHKMRCDALRSHITAQVKSGESEKYILSLPNELVSKDTDTFFYIPLFLEKANVLHRADFTVFLHEETRLDLNDLVEFLSQQDRNQPLYFGKGLQDHDVYITHHFSQSNMSYPDLYSGFILSHELVYRISRFLESSKSLKDFSFRIDPIYELSLLLETELKVTLKTVPGMCATNQPDSHCFTWFGENTVFPHCHNSVPQSDIVIAVKTHQKNFDSVLSVVRKTWARSIDNILYFADVEDKSIPTIDVGVPNTEFGHCDKLNQIMKHLANNESLVNVTWFVIADDDTILNVDRLRAFLACYHPKDKSFVIGERYGYLSTHGRFGYQYPTGGSGTVFTRTALLQIVKSGINKCGAANSPDDMSLGSWMQHLEIPIVHSHLFHQSTPNNYCPSLLLHQKPISFHKHFQVDPIAVYTEQLGAALIPDQVLPKTEL